jgi:ribosomal protein L34
MATAALLRSAWPLEAWTWVVHGFLTMAYPEAIDVFQTLQPGDRVEVVHEVKVGFRKWATTTRGTMVSKERRRHSLHFRRNYDDKVFSDVMLLRRDDGELTTVTLDEFSELKKLPS